MLRAILTILALLALPAGASAAPLGELPFRSTGGAAACLQATGKPGEVVRWVRGGVETLEARADGLHATGGARLGTYWTCPAVAGDPDGAAVLVVGLWDDDAGEWNGLRVVVREPGATGWSTPVTVPARHFADLDVAVSARGDAVVVWQQLVSGAGERGEIRAVRRAPGGRFGPVETLGAFRSEFRDGVEAGMSAIGEAVVTSTQVRSGRTAAVVQTALPGTPFGAPRTLLVERDAEAPALAVAPDGRALAAVRDRVYERPPGGDFGVAQVVAQGEGAGPPLLALRADGAAAVVYAGSWRSPAVAVTRPGPGPFSPGVVLTPASPPLNGPFGFGLVLPEANPPIEPYPEPTVSFGPDGRALLVRPTDDRDERDQRRLLAVTFPVAGVAGAVESTRLGSPVRDASGLAPLALADGRFAAAWTDDRGAADAGPRDGRLHLAVEGLAPAPEPAAPTVTVGAPRPRALRPAQALRLPVRCSAACDVRVVVRGHPHGMDFTGSLPRAGTLQLRLRPASKGLAPRRGRLRLTLHVAAPGGRSAARRDVSVALRRLPAPRLPRVLDLRARRAGNAIVVRWRLDGPVRDAFQFASGSSGPSPERGRLEVGLPRRVGHGVYEARIPRAARLRYVHVVVASLVPSRRRSARLAVPLT